MRALIIDDEQYVRLVLEHTLREEGCDVVVASDGRRVLWRFKARRSTASLRICVCRVLMD